MSVSTKDVISIGLAHEFIMALQRRGVTKEMISTISNSSGVADRVSAYIRGDLGKKVRAITPDEDRPITCLGLPTHALNCLQGLQTVSELLQLSERELLKVRTLGLTTLRQIKDALEREGFPPLNLE